MAAKITQAKFRQWFERGETEMLAEHWNNPNFQTIRHDIIKNKSPGATWQRLAYQNGKTLAWLVKHDPQIAATLPLQEDGRMPMELWFDLFLHEGHPHYNLFGLLDIAPSEFQKKPMLDMLHTLMKEEATRLLWSGQWETRLIVWAEVHTNVHELVQRYEGHGLLPALAWLGMIDHWGQRDSPRLAQLIQTAARQHPSEVLASYLIAHHDLVLRGKNHYHRYYPDVTPELVDNIRIHIVNNACAAGMDTTMFETHAQTFWSLRSAWQDDIDARSAVVYANGVFDHAHEVSLSIPAGLSML